MSQQLPFIATPDGATGDDVTIEAAYLAAQLGLSVEELRAEMRQGLVYSLVEKGIGQDEGRLRLTVRHRAKSWTRVVTSADLAGGTTADDVHDAGGAAPRPDRSG